MAIPCYMPQGIYYWVYKHSTRVITHMCMKILAYYVNCDDKVAIDSCHSSILDYQKFENKIFKVDQKTLKSLEIGALEIFWLYGIIRTYIYFCQCWQLSGPLSTCWVKCTYVSICTSYNIGMKYSQHTYTCMYGA